MRWGEEAEEVAVPRAQPAAPGTPSKSPYHKAFKVQMLRSAALPQFWLAPSNQLLFDLEPVQQDNIHCIHNVSQLR